jgi:hypothetical protein
MRGVTVDILVPEQSNHRVLDWARPVPLRTCSRPAAGSGCCRRRSTIPS